MNQSIETIIVILGIAAGGTFGMVVFYWLVDRSHEKDLKDRHD